MATQLQSPSDTADKEVHMTSSQVGNTIWEDWFLRNAERFIAYTVHQFAAAGGHYEENIGIIEDMKQESRLAVLERFRRGGSQVATDLSPYRGVIQNACLKVVNNNKSISLPQFCYKNGEKNKKEESWKGIARGYKYSSIEMMIENNDIEMLGSGMFEDWLALKIIIEDAFEQSSPQDKRILMLLGSGFSVSDIAKLLHMKQDAVRTAINRARRTLERKGLADELAKGRAKWKRRVPGGQPKQTANP